MPRDAEAREWWADVYEVRERIERQRAREYPSAARRGAPRRGVREVRTASRLTLVHSAPQVSVDTPRRRPRPTPIQRIGPRPDRIAAWAVALGILLLVLAIVSSH